MEDFYQINVIKILNKIFIVEKIFMLMIICGKRIKIIFINRIKIK